MASIIHIEIYISFFKHQIFCLEMADLCQYYLGFCSEILTFPCVFLLLPYSFFKCLMMAFSFKSNIFLIFMPYSEHPFCCNNVIKSSCKNNVLHMFHIKFLYLYTSAYTRANTFLSTRRKYGVIRTVYTGRLVGSWFLYLAAMHCFSGLRASTAIALIKSTWYTVISCFSWPDSQHFVEETQDIAYWGTIKGMATKPSHQQATKGN